jgi:hypothetical protein
VWQGNGGNAVLGFEGMALVDDGTQSWPWDADEYQFKCTYEDSNGNTFDENGNGGTYWQKVLNGECLEDWTWTLPVGMSNAEAQRDFTFTMTAIAYAFDPFTGKKILDSNGNKIVAADASLSIDVHIAYAEVQLQFAGEGGFAPKTVQGGQTSANTVVVRQKVQAKVKVDPFLTVTGYYQWSSPTPNDAVKDYITNDTQGTVVYHDVCDYSANEFVFYYTNTASPLRTGGISCYLDVTYVIGNQTNYHSMSVDASYYIVAPTGVSLSATQTGTELKGVKLYLGDSSTPTPTEGMTFTASVTATTYAGGEVGFMQTTKANRFKVEKNAQGVSEAWVRTSGANSVLDQGVPYEVKKPGTKEKDNLTAGGSTTIDTVDSPFFNLIDFSLESVMCADIFTMYVIYNPLKFPMSTSVYPLGKRTHVLRTCQFSRYPESCIVRESAIPF